MAEKVYGIIGTNKAMKEVIPKTNLLVLETEISGSTTIRRCMIWKSSGSASAWEQLIYQRQPT